MSDLTNRRRTSTLEETAATVAIRGETALTILHAVNSNVSHDDDETIKNREELKNTEENAEEQEISESHMAVDEFRSACYSVWEMIVRHHTRDQAVNAFATNSKIQSKACLGAADVRRICLLKEAEDPFDTPFVEEELDKKAIEIVSAVPNAHIMLELFEDEASNNSANNASASENAADKSNNKSGTRRKSVDRTKSRQIMSDTSFIDTHDFVYVRIWKSRREGRKFQSALRALSHTRQQLLLPVIFAVPHSTALAYQGKFVTVTWLVPLMDEWPTKMTQQMRPELADDPNVTGNTNNNNAKGSNATTVQQKVIGTLLGQVDECWRVALGIPLGASEPLPFYLGADGKYYVFAVNEVHRHKVERLVNISGNGGLLAPTGVTAVTMQNNIKKIIASSFPSGRAPFGNGKEMFSGSTTHQRFESQCVDSFAERISKRAAGEINTRHLHNAIYDRLMRVVSYWLQNPGTMPTDELDLFSKLFKTAGLNMQYLYHVRAFVEDRFQPMDGDNSNTTTNSSAAYASTTNHLDARKASISAPPVAPKMVNSLYSPIASSSVSGLNNLNVNNNPAPPMNTPAVGTMGSSAIARPTSARRALEKCSSDYFKLNEAILFSNQTIRCDRDAKIKFLKAIDEEMACRSVLSIVEASILAAAAGENNTVLTEVDTGDDKASNTNIDHSGQGGNLEAIITATNNVLFELRNNIAYLKQDVMTVLRAKFSAPHTFVLAARDISLQTICYFVSDRLGLAFDDAASKFVGFEPPLPLSHTGRGEISPRPLSNPLYTHFVNHSVTAALWHDLLEKSTQWDEPHAYRNVAAIMTVFNLSLSAGARPVVGHTQITTQLVEKLLPTIVKIRFGNVLDGKIPHPKVSGWWYGVALMSLTESCPEDTHLSRRELALLAGLPTLSATDVAVICDRSFYLYLYSRQVNIPLSINERARLLKVWGGAISLGHGVFDASDPMWHIRTIGRHFAFFATLPHNVDHVLTSVEFIGLRRDITSALAICAGGCDINFTDDTEMDVVKAQKVARGVLQTAAVLVLAFFDDLLDEDGLLHPLLAQHCCSLIGLLDDNSYAIAMALSVAVANKMNIKVVTLNPATGEKQDDTLPAALDDCKYTFGTLADAQNYNDQLVEVGSEDRSLATLKGLVNAIKSYAEKWSARGGGVGSNQKVADIEAARILNMAKAIEYFISCAIFDKTKRAQMVEQQQANAGTDGGLTVVPFVRERGGLGSRGNLAMSFMSVDAHGASFSNSRLHNDETDKGDDLAVSFASRAAVVLERSNRSMALATPSFCMTPATNGGFLTVGGAGGRAVSAGVNRQRRPSLNRGGLDASNFGAAFMSSGSGANASGNNARAFTDLPSIQIPTLPGGPNTAPNTTAGTTTGAGAKSSSATAAGAAAPTVGGASANNNSTNLLSPMVNNGMPFGVTGGTTNDTSAAVTPIQHPTAATTGKSLNEKAKITTPLPPAPLAFNGSTGAVPPASSGLEAAANKVNKQNTPMPPALSGLATPAGASGIFGGASGGNRTPADGTAAAGGSGMNGLNKAALEASNNNDGAAEDDYCGREEAGSPTNGIGIVTNPNLYVLPNITFGTPAVGSLARDGSPPPVNFNTATSGGGLDSGSANLNVNNGTTTAATAASHPTDTLLSNLLSAGNANNNNNNNLRPSEDRSISLLDTSASATAASLNRSYSPHHSPNRLGIRSAYLSRMASVSVDPTAHTNAPNSTTTSASPNHNQQQQSGADNSSNAAQITSADGEIDGDRSVGGMMVRTNTAAPTTFANRRLGEYGNEAVDGTTTSVVVTGGDDCFDASAAAGTPNSGSNNSKSANPDGSTSPGSGALNLSGGKTGAAATGSTAIVTTTAVATGAAALGIGGLGALNTSTQLGSDQKPIPISGSRGDLAEASANNTSGSTLSLETSLQQQQRSAKAAATKKARDEAEAARKADELKSLEQAKKEAEIISEEARKQREADELKRRGEREEMEAAKLKIQQMAEEAQRAAADAKKSVEEAHRLAAEVAKQRATEAEKHRKEVEDLQRARAEAEAKSIAVEKEMAEQMRKVQEAWLKANTDAQHALAERDATREAENRRLLAEAQAQTEKMLKDREAELKIRFEKAETEEEQRRQIALQKAIEAQSVKAKEWSDNLSKKEQERVAKADAERREWEEKMRAEEERNKQERFLRRQLIEDEANVRFTVVDAEAAVRRALEEACLGDRSLVASREELRQQTEAANQRRKAEEDAERARVMGELQEQLAIEEQHLSRRMAAVREKLEKDERLQVERREESLRSEIENELQRRFNDIIDERKVAEIRLRQLERETIRLQLLNGGMIPVKSSTLQTILNAVSAEEDNERRVATLEEKYRRAALREAFEIELKVIAEEKAEARYRQNHWGTQTDEDKDYNYYYAGYYYTSGVKPPMGGSNNTASTTTTGTDASAGNKNAATTTAAPNNNNARSVIPVVPNAASASTVGSTSASANNNGNDGIIAAPVKLNKAADVFTEVVGTTAGNASAADAGPEGTHAKAATGAATTATNAHTNNAPSTEVTVPAGGLTVPAAADPTNAVATPLTNAITSASTSPKALAHTPAPPASLPMRRMSAEDGGVALCSPECGAKATNVDGDGINIATTTTPTNFGANHGGAVMAPRPPSSTSGSGAGNNAAAHSNDAAGPSSSSSRGGAPTGTSTALQMRRPQPPQQQQRGGVINRNPYGISATAVVGGGGAAAGQQSPTTTPAATSGGGMNAVRAALGTLGAAANTGDANPNGAAAGGGGVYSRTSSRFSSNVNSSRNTPKVGPLTVVASSSSAPAASGTTAAGTPTAEEVAAASNANANTSEITNQLPPPTASDSPNHTYHAAPPTATGTSTSVGLAVNRNTAAAHHSHHQQPHHHHQYHGTAATTAVNVSGHSNGSNNGSPHHHQQQYHSGYNHPGEGDNQHHHHHHGHHHQQQQHNTSYHSTNSSGHGAVGGGGVNTSTTLSVMTCPHCYQPSYVQNSATVLPGMVHQQQQLQMAATTTTATTTHSSGFAAMHNHQQGGGAFALAGAAQTYHPQMPENANNNTNGSNGHFLGTDQQQHKQQQFVRRRHSPYYYMTPEQRDATKSLVQKLNYAGGGQQ